MSTPQDKHPTDATPLTLGAAIRHAREQQQMSVRGLAAKVHMHPSYIARIEAGAFKQPSPEKLQRIAGHLDINYHDLCALAGYQAPGLPAFLPYLRAKYAISNDDARSLSEHFERLRRQHGIIEKPNQF